MTAHSSATPAPWWHPATLALTAFVLYWNVLPAPFVFDDERAIVVNEQIRHLATAFSPTERGSPLAGRPLVGATFAVNYAIDGLNVRGYRLVNIAIHAACALLLVALLRRHLPAGPAFAAALIWTVHPLVTEPVDYVSQRTELMMAAFFLLTLYAAQRASADGSRRARWLALSIVCCAMGMACKETMAVAPLVVWIYDATFVFGSYREAARQRRAYYLGLCATWLVLVALLASSPRGDSAGFAGASVSPWEYLLNQSVMIVRYLRLAVWPQGLVLDYGEPAALTLTAVAPYAAGVAALLVATVGGAGALAHRGVPGRVVLPDARADIERHSDFHRSGRRTTNVPASDGDRRACCVDGTDADTPHRRPHLAPSHPRTHRRTT